MRRESKVAMDNSRGCRSSKRSGFGLIDCIVGFGLIITGLMVTLNVLPTTEKAARMARQNVLATHLGQATIEQTTSLPFDTIVQTTATPVTLTSIINQSTQSVVFTPTITVSKVTNDLKDVVCTVTWKDSTSSTLIHSVSMETLVARRQ